MTQTGGKVQSLSRPGANLVQEEQRRRKVPLPGGTVVQG